MTTQLPLFVPVCCRCRSPDAHWNAAQHWRDEFTGYLCSDCVVWRTRRTPIPELADSWLAVGGRCCECQAPALCALGAPTFPDALRVDLVRWYCLPCALAYNHKPAPVKGLERAAGTVIRWPCTYQDLHFAWRQAARRTHPDAGGSHDAFIAAKQHYEAALRMQEGA